MNPSFSSTASPAPDALLAGELPRVTQDVTVAVGENLLRGAVLGKVTIGEATPAANAGNAAGSGTIASATTGAGAKAGVYNIICIEPATGAARFAVEDPDGVIVGIATENVAFSGPVNFTISDANDFVAGNGFTITVAAGTGHWKRSVAAATDGSQRPLAILVGDVDATAAAKNAPVYRTGEFNEAALNFGAGHSASSVRAALEAVQIYLKTTVPN